MERLTDYDYELPDELIAQAPLEDRAGSRLLWLHRESGVIEDRKFRDIVDILQPEDLLVWNDTRVSALRLKGAKPTGGAVEALVLRETSEGTFAAMVKPGKRLKPGAVIEFGASLKATVTAQLEEPLKEIRFDQTPGWRTEMEAHGRVPLPPYITEEIQDPERYQTVYSRTGGSAAAPTAGLHFTEELLERLDQRGVQTAHVTLDVSLDTFRPVVAENLAEHKMHGETCTLSEATAAKIERAKGRIIAVGTTTARTLESFAIGSRRVRSGTMSTSIFIRPGFSFQVIDGLFTNFHLPRTTMLMMISALASKDRIDAAYHHATQHRYRFLSFGDSMLIL